MRALLIAALLFIVSLPARANDFSGPAPAPFGISKCQGIQVVGTFAGGASVPGCLTLDYTYVGPYPDFMIQVSTYPGQTYLSGALNDLYSKAGTPTPSSSVCIDSSAPPAWRFYLCNIANLGIVSNISGSSAEPSANGLPAIIDATIDNTQGDILTRSASGWTKLTPGTSGQYLKTGGASANASWSNIALSSLSGIGNLGIVSNISGGTAAPSANGISAILDATVDNTQGDILTRSGAGWTNLTPGSAGQVLKTGGASANVSWANVDDSIVALLVTRPVKASGNANVASLSGTTTLDGVSLSVGDTVILTAQTTGSQNGPWVIQSSSWTRPTWYTSASTTQAVYGMMIVVAQGTARAGTHYYLATTSVTIDTTSTTWTAMTQVLTSTNTASMNGVAIGQSTAAAGKFTTLSITSAYCNQTAPTISSGFGSSPSIATNNGNCMFTINVGTGGSASSGVIGLPSVTNGWQCDAIDITNPTTGGGFYVKQTAGTVSSVTLTGYNTSGAATAWTASDLLRVKCGAN